MADYIYLLQNQLSPAQQFALQSIREVVRGKGLTLFLTGGAVRDLTSGASVRDLDLTVQGNPLKLKKELEKTGAIVEGEIEESQTLFLVYPGGVRVEVSAAVSITYPKPGKPVYTPASILDDLRSRDFTANAMAISLNEGSYGLLMDPLNGVADIENRELRLVSNYGFIEDPARLIRAARLSSRLGWMLEEKTQARYQTAKDEGYISALSPLQQGYELEEIAHEEDPLRTLKTLEGEGWMKHLSSTWGSAKVNASALNDLQTKNGQLHSQGIISYPDTVQFPLLVAKMDAKDVTALKKKFPRQGFVESIASVENKVKELQAKLTSKEVAAPSASYKLLHASDPATVLGLYVNGKGAPVQNKFKAFFSEWPAARQRIPYQLMAEMRITPDLPIYQELLDKLFFELMDNKLGTPEEMKAYLEPYSPPAPPPPVSLRRPRAKKEAKAPRKSKKAVAAEEAAEPMSLPNEVEGRPVGTAPERDGGAPKPASKIPPAAKVAPAPKKAAAPAPVKKAAPAAKKAAVPAKKAAAPAKKAAAKPAAKTVAKKAAPPAKKAVAKKPAPKPAAKKAAPAKKPAPKKVAPAKKAVAKKPAPKPAKKTGKKR